MPLLLAGVVKSCCVVACLAAGALAVAAPSPTGSGLLRGPVADACMICASSAVQQQLQQRAAPQLSSCSNGRLPAAMQAASIAPYSSSWVRGSTGDVPARVGCLGLPELTWRQPAAAAAGLDALTDADVYWAPALSSGGSVVYDASELAVFTHAWDPCGTQLFAGGGPVVLAGRGCSVALCC
jgi:hypothetical protein